MMKSDFIIERVLSGGYSTKAVYDDQSQFRNHSTRFSTLDEDVFFICNILLRSLHNPLHVIVDDFFISFTYPDNNPKRIFNILYVLVTCLQTSKHDESQMNHLKVVVYSVL